MGWQVNPDVVVNRITVSGAGGGIFVYSGTPALGNLIETSGIQTAGTDAYGNAYLAGDTTYVNNSGTFIACQKTANGISWATATSAAGPYTSTGAFIDWTTASSGTMFVDGGVNGITFQSPPFLFQGNMSATEALTLSDSSVPATPSGAASLFAVSPGHLKYVDPSGAAYDTGRASGIATGQTVSSTSFTALAGMTVKLGIGTYRFRVLVALAAASSAGQWQLELLYSGTTSAATSNFRFTSAAGVVQCNINQALGISNGGPATSVAGAYWAEFEGTLTTTAAGNLSVSGLTTVAADTWAIAAGSSYIDAYPVV